jgi:hypothetical protein
VQHQQDYTGAHVCLQFQCHTSDGIRYSSVVLCSVLCFAGTLQASKMCIFCQTTVVTQRWGSSTDVQTANNHWLSSHIFRPCKRHLSATGASHSCDTF